MYLIFMLLFVFQYAISSRARARVSYVTLIST